jgi:prolyl 4-hydroxylase
MTGIAAQLRRGDGIAIVDDFLKPTTCADILEELEYVYWTPSAVVRRGTEGRQEVGLSLARVSESAGNEWFGDDLRRAIASLERRICRSLALDRRRLEEWQATRYRRGGRFDAHLDGGLFADEPAGERDLTLLVYLTTPSEGGSTWFPELGREIAATRGRLIAWHNLLEDGRPDPTKRHAARPLRRGRKVVLTTWSRVRPIRPDQRRRRKE